MSAASKALFSSSADSISASRSSSSRSLRSEPSSNSRQRVLRILMRISDAARWSMSLSIWMRRSVLRAICSWFSLSRMRSWSANSLTLAMSRSRISALEAPSGTVPGGMRSRRSRTSSNDSRMLLTMVSPSTSSPSENPRDLSSMSRICRFAVASLASLLRAKIESWKRRRSSSQCLCPGVARSNSPPEVLSSVDRVDLLVAPEGVAGIWSSRVARGYAISSWLSRTIMF